MSKETKIEKIKRYQNEGRGLYWFLPWWKKIFYIISFPLLMFWFFFCWCLMKMGRGLFQLGDFLSGWRWNQGDWSEDV